MNFSISHRMLASIAFFGSLFFIDNAFIQIPPTLKFSLFFGMQLLGCAIVFRKDDWKRLERLNIPLCLIVIFYTLSLARFNPVIKDYGREISPILGILSLLTLCTSVFFSRYLNVRHMAKALIIVLTPISAMLIYHFSDLMNPLFNSWYTVGDLRFDSYQTVSEILSLTAISALFIMLTTKSIAAKIPMFGIFCVCGIYIFQGFGRGEAIAFIIGAALLIAPRATIIAAPFSWSLIRLVAFAIDTPLTERMRLIFEGNYGDRDFLIEKAGSMLHSEPSLILFGGGMNYFQSYWGLTSGLYPHNILIEALITGGIALVVPMAVLFLWPIAKTSVLAFRSPLSRDQSYGLAIMTFVIILALKSGSMLSMWETMLFAGLYCRANVVVAHSRVQMRPAVAAVMPGPRPLMAIVSTTDQIPAHKASIPAVRSLASSAL